MKIAALISLAAFASASFGQIGYAGYMQTRTLSASAFLGGGGAYSSASDTNTGIYNDSVTAVKTVQTGPNFFVSTTSTANIVSDLEPGFISITGSFSQSVGAFAGTGQARGRVTCDIQFELLTPVLYHLNGVTGIPGMSPPNDPVYRDVTLLGPGGFSVAPGPFAFIGTLGAGVYTLHVDVECRRPGWDTPGFSVLFEIPNIPAPGTGMVALGGVGAMGLRRRRG